MTSLTTLFVVGPEEYVEFNESMGSKAFVEHIWDQSRSPLKVEDTSAWGTQLHSVGARISKAPPPRIEFPTVVRLKGRGNKYQLSGRFISWEELKRRNPIALRDPPSLDEFIKQGSQIGSAERIEPGAFLKGEKRFKLNKKPTGTVEVHESQDGWIGGSSESIYAPKAQLGGASESIYATKPLKSNGEDFKSLPTGGSSDSIYAPKTTNLHVTNQNVDKTETPAEMPRTIRKSRSGLSLWARLGIEAPLEDAEKQKDVSSSSSDESAKKHTQQRPGKLTLPDNRNVLLMVDKDDASKTPIAQTPLSATHSPPETPLKRHGNKGKFEIPPTPNTQERFSQADSSIDQPKAGLMLDPGQTQAITPTLSEPPALPLADTKPVRKTVVQPVRAARNQMDEMLARLRQARSGLSGGDSSQSIWAPKKKVEEPTNPVLPKETQQTSLIATPSIQSGDDGEKTVAEKEASVSQIEPEVVSSKGEKSSGKSLFDRLGPKIDVPERKPSKKERKRGGRNHNNNEDSGDTSSKEISETVSSSSSVVTKETEKDQNTQELERKDSLTREEDVSTPTPANPNPSATLSVKEEKESELEEENKVSEEKISESTSHIGNDTFTSFDWADDDDESLPELTEEWMKVALLSSPSKPEQAKSVISEQSEATNSSFNTESKKDNIAFSDTQDHKAAKRERKGRAGKREKDRGMDERPDRNSSSVQGIRIAGTANPSTPSRQKPNDPKELSSVPPWQRRSTAISPPKEPLGLRIAGRATESHHSKSDEKGSHSSSKPKRNNIPSAPSNMQQRGGRGGGFSGSVMPPNATPLHTDGHPLLTKSESTVSIKTDGSSKGRAGR